MRRGWRWMARAAPGASSRPSGVLLEELDDLLERHSGTEDALEARLLQLRDVLRGDDPAARDDDVRGLLLLQDLHDAREERHVRAAEGAEPDRVDVLLDRRRHDVLRRLPQARVDDLHARVPEGARDHLHPAVVAVQARLRHEDADLLRHGSPQYRRGSSHAPTTSRSVAQISPRVASARTASTIKGIVFSVPFAARRSAASARSHFALVRALRIVLSRASCRSKA